MAGRQAARTEGLAGDGVAADAHGGHGRNGVEDLEEICLVDLRREVTDVQSSTAVDLGVLAIGRGRARVVVTVGGGGSRGRGRCRSGGRGGGGGGVGHGDGAGCLKGEKFKKKGVRKRERGREEK